MYPRRASQRGVDGSGYWSSLWRKTQWNIALLWRKMKLKRPEGKVPSASVIPISPPGPLASMKVPILLFICIYQSTAPSPPHIILPLPIYIYPSFSSYFLCCFSIPFGIHIQNLTYNEYLKCIRKGSIPKCNMFLFLSGLMLGELFFQRWLHREHYTATMVPKSTKVNAATANANIFGNLD